MIPKEGKTRIIWDRECFAPWDAKRPDEDMCGNYRVMWRGYGMSKEGYGASQQHLGKMLSFANCNLLKLKPVEHSLYKSSGEETGMKTEVRNPKVNNQAVSSKSKLVTKMHYLWPCCLLLSTDLHNVLSLHRHYKLWILVVLVDVGVHRFTQRKDFQYKPIGGCISPEAKVMAGVSDVDVLLGGILSTEDNTGYGMIHNDEDGDSNANDGDDDEREISWK
ncbi:hypothetical protein Tco_0161575 [Tanacetum coccineum]